MLFFSKKIVFFSFKGGNEAREPWLDPNHEQGLVLEGKPSPKAYRMCNLFPEEQENSLTSQG